MGEVPKAIRYIQTCNLQRKYGVEKAKKKKKEGERAGKNVTLSEGAINASVQTYGRQSNGISIVSLRKNMENKFHIEIFRKNFGKISEIFRTLEKII